jgi:predicted RNA polymerase sigma factor
LALPLRVIGGLSSEGWARSPPPTRRAIDWDRIVVLYEALNRVVAVAMASGPAQLWP